MKSIIIRLILAWVTLLAAIYSILVLSNQWAFTGLFIAHLLLRRYPRPILPDPPSIIQTASLVIVLVAMFFIYGLSSENHAFRNIILWVCGVTAFALQFTWDMRALRDLSNTAEQGAAANP